MDGCIDMDRRMKRSGLHDVSRSHLSREFIVGESFGRRPFDGELSTGVGRVRVVAHQTRQTKVGHFD